MEHGGDIGMVGLGLMGSAMSARLLAAGHGVHGFDVAAAARDAHAARGGTLAPDAAGVAAHCGLVILSLPNGAVLREVCLGSGALLETVAAGGVIIDTTVSPPALVVEIAQRFATVGATYLDVGISGNSAMVLRGEGLAVVGGDLDAAPRATGALSAICREVRHVGTSGDGVRAKLVINHVLQLHRLALAEGLVFAEALGIDGGAALSFLQASAAYSRAMDAWGPRMVARDYQPPASRVANSNKDLQLILGLARDVGAPTPALNQGDLVMRAMLANGLGDADNAVIAEMLRALAGFGDLAAAAAPTAPAPPTAPAGPA